MLLLGLGLAPAWTERDGLSAGGLYYGPEPEAVPSASVGLRMQAETAAYFVARVPFDPARMGTLRWGEVDWPLPFDGGELATEKDLIASAFFWLAGWPEWTSRPRDQHGRYPYAGSLQERFDLALVPIVDVYRRCLGERLAARGHAVPGRTWAGRTWAVSLTVDVDFVRTRRLGRLARGLKAARFREALGALAMGDPRWEALERLGDRLAEQGGTAFLKAGATAPEDVGYRLEAPRVRRWIDGLAHRGVEIGLHPSYAAFDHPGRLHAERDRLAAVVSRPLRWVRSHYLRWSEPTTPRLYAEAGFLHDSTLGFSRQEGFRRGTCHPFRVFDLGANRPLDLWEWPLVAMDTTLFVHQRRAPDEAERTLARVLAAVRRMGGCATLLWHNDPQAGPDGLAVLERVVERARGEGAALGGGHELLAKWGVPPR